VVPLGQYKSCPGSQFPPNTVFRCRPRALTRRLLLNHLVAAWEHPLEFGEAFLGETLLEFRGRDIVEVF
jgi:hypothetical protein